MQDYYDFETKYFRFSDDELQLLRSRFPFKKIPLKNIDSISLSKGSKLKYPVGGVLFGLTILTFSILLLLQSFGFIDYISEGNVKGGESVGTGRLAYVLISLVGFTSFVGILSLIQALVPTIVMKTKYIDGKNDTFPLTSLKKKGQLEDFKMFLSEKFKTTSTKLNF